MCPVYPLGPEEQQSISNKPGIPRAERWLSEQQLKPQSKTNAEKEATATVKHNLIAKKDQNKRAYDEHGEGETRSRREVHWARTSQQLHKVNKEICL